MGLLKTPEALNEFRMLSSKFRDGSCTGQAYYEHCQCAMLSSFNNLFPELLAMLPDISKQQARVFAEVPRYLQTNPFILSTSRNSIWCTNNI